VKQQTLFRGNTLHCKGTYSTAQKQVDALTQRSRDSPSHSGRKTGSIWTRSTFLFVAIWRAFIAPSHTCTTVAMDYSCVQYSVNDRDHCQCRPEISSGSQVRK